MTARVWENDKGDPTLVGVVDEACIADRGSDAVVTLDPADDIAQRMFDNANLPKEQRCGYFLTVDRDGQRRMGVLKSWTLGGKRGDRHMVATFVDRESLLAA